MACYVEVGASTPAGSPVAFSALGPVATLLTSGAAGTLLIGVGETMIVSSDESGWLHVSTTVNTDKAEIGKTRRIIAGIPRVLGGVGGGMYVSFLADA